MKSVGTKKTDYVNTTRENVCTILHSTIVCTRIIANVYICLHCNFPICFAHLFHSCYINIRLVSVLFSVVFFCLP